LNDRIRLGVSACLLGEHVRYNGGHKRDRWIADVLGPHVEFVPVCPEVECGLPVPRETMHLVGDPDHPRLLTIRTGIDHTSRMARWARQRVRELARRGNLCGFIFKSGSPSCGMKSVRMHAPEGRPSRRGVGMFARAFMESLPHVPVEDDGRLHDPVLRENFIERIFTTHRWHALLAAGRRRGRLVQFHAENSLLVLAHSPKHAKALGTLVARAKALSPTALFGTYFDLLAEALKLKATVAKHCHVLEHILGHFKRQLAADEKQEVLEVIAAFRRSHVPLIVPVTLLNHTVRQHGQLTLAQQTYLHPHPLELHLRNHV